MCALPLIVEDVDVVLDAAVPLYWMFGRMDVTLAVLAQETGVAEAALERLFGDARGAYLAALDRYVGGCAAVPFRAWLAEGAAGFAAAVLDLVYDGLTGRGCLLTLAICDHAAADSAVAAAVGVHVGQLMALAAGRPGLAPQALVLALAGAAARARAGRPRPETAAALAAVLGFDPAPEGAAAEDILAAAWTGAEGEAPPGEEAPEGAGSGEVAADEMPAMPGEGAREDAADTAFAAEVMAAMAWGEVPEHAGGERGADHALTAMAGGEDPEDPPGETQDAAGAG